MTLLRADNPNVVVFVGLIGQVGGAKVSVEELNTLVAKNVKALNTEASPVVAVDFYAHITKADLADKVHPSFGGADKMADIWFQALSDNCRR